MLVGQEHKLSMLSWEVGDVDHVPLSLEGLPPFQLFTFIHIQKFIFSAIFYGVLLHLYYLGLLFIFTSLDSSLHYSTAS